MPNRQKMQDSSRPGAVKKAAVTAANAVGVEERKPSKPVAAEKPSAVAKSAASAKAAKPKAAKSAPPTKKDGGVGKAAKPTKVLDLDKSPQPAVADEAIKPAKDARQKHKLVRDSFTLPREDFELIHMLKERALGLKRPTKKSELLRAGLQALARLDAAELKQRLDALVTLTPGRPKKHR